jgi:hypothetical protein
MTKIKFDVEEIVAEQIAQIDEAIETIERRMKPYEKLNVEKQKLLSARRALLGGNRLTGAGGTRLQLEDIIDHLKGNPGAVASQIAERFGVPVGTVSSHIYRNKDRFVKDRNGGLHNAGSDDE